MRKFFGKFVSVTLAAAVIAMFALSSDDKWCSRVDKAFDESALGSFLNESKAGYGRYATGTYPNTGILCPYFPSSCSSIAFSLGYSIFDVRFKSIPHILLSALNSAMPRTSAARERAAPLQLITSMAGRFRVHATS